MNNKYLVVAKHKTTFIVNVNKENMSFHLTGNMLKTTPVYVGDFVDVNVEDKTIIKLYPRNNFLIRPVVSNIDQVIIIMSIKKPEFSSLLIEKFLAYANFASVKPLIIVTKKDLATKQEINEVEKYLAFLKVENLIIDNLHELNFDHVVKLLENKKTALMGQSGVGKSTLINKLNPDFNRLTGDYSIKLGRGKHTTKEVIMLPFAGGYVIDTPGFSSFDLPMTKGDLALNYPSFTPFANKCYFSNCLHLSEHSCAVKDALKNGLILEETYANYVKIISELLLNKEDY